jgi:hypothetical protein
MSVLSDARQAAADALAAVGAQVYSGPPRTQSTPSVVIRPGDPWLDVEGVVSLELACSVRTTGPRTALAALEELAGQVLAALRSGGFSPGPLGRAGEDAETGLYTAVIPITYREC